MVKLQGIVKACVSVRDDVGECVCVRVRVLTGRKVLRKRCLSRTSQVLRPFMRLRAGSSELTSTSSIAPCVCLNICTRARTFSTSFHNPHAHLSFSALEQIHVICLVNAGFAELWWTHAGIQTSMHTGIDNSGWAESGRMQQQHTCACMSACKHMCTQACQSEDLHVRPHMRVCRYLSMLGTVSVHVQQQPRPPQG